MNTSLMLLAQYGQLIIPVDTVAADFFRITREKFLRKCLYGEIALPIVRMERSQKCARGVHVNDLADFIEARRAAAKRELEPFLR